MALGPALDLGYVDVDHVDIDLDDLTAGHVLDAGDDLAPDLLGHRGQRIAVRDDELDVHEALKGDDVTVNDIIKRSR